MTAHPRLLALAILTLGSLTGCTTPAPGPYTPPGEIARNPLEAQRLNQEAASLMDSDPQRAEALLREALTQDLYCGPAHNNLGVLFLRAAPPKLYEAAGEFEWAGKLLPGHPDPRVNLALTMEQAGRSEDAIASYRTALEAYPDYLPAVQGLTSLQLRTSKSDDHTPARLRDIALRGSSEQWRSWARLQLAKRE